jgi:hypothetical protein
MAKRWFMTRDGKKRYGPFSRAQLRQLVSSGRLLPSDMLWPEGAPKWVPASSVSGLFSQERETTIRLFEHPSLTSPESMAGQPLTSLLVAGIVNPFGPTLSAVVVAGALRTGATLPVVKLMLNPFNQAVHAVGELAVRGSWRPEAVMGQLFGLPFGGCPTLLLPSVHLDEDRSLSVHAEFLRGFEGGREVLRAVRQYLGNPWDRVSQEIHDGAEAFVKSRTSAGHQAHDKQLNEDEARELAGLLLSEEHTRLELQAFLYAWEGSLKLQREQGLPALADMGMSLRTFQGIFTRIAESCRVPAFDGSVPTNPITELRQAAEIAFHQGYKVQDKAKAEEALTVLVTRLFELFGPTPQFNQFFQVLDVVKRAVEVEDWESGTVPLLTVLAKLRQVEAAIIDEQG